MSEMKARWILRVEGPGTSLTVQCDTLDEANAEFYRAVASVLSPYRDFGDYYKLIPPTPTEGGTDR